MERGGGGGEFVTGRLGMEWLFRRKRVDVVAQTTTMHRQLAKRLSLFDLVAIGVGSTIGAGVYILVGTVAREHTGPALPLSFLIAGIAAALSAYCYAELACRCPSAGSAYHYSYLCIGEGIAWLIGWALILEYTLGGAAVARGISPNLALFFGGEDKLPAILTRHTLFGILVDPCAAILVFIMTGLLCIGIKESSLTQAIITVTNVCALLFIVVAGSYLGYKNGWAGYELSSGYIPFGAKGFFAGSAAVFFSYVGFDCITSTAEEVKHPQRDMPLGIGISLSVCGMLYMLVSAVIVGLVPYYDLDPDTPISSVFASFGMKWAEYIITTGAVTALCASLMGAILPQPRILMAMARDGLLPSFFSDISKHSRVPVKSTLVTGLFIAILAFLMDVSQLTGMVSVGTLLAFTIVAISVLILRYIPPMDVPILSQTHESFDSVSLQHSTSTQEVDRENGTEFRQGKARHPIYDGATDVVRYPLLQKELSQGSQDELKRRKTATWSITLACAGILVLASAASAEGLTIVLRLMISGVGGLLLLYCLVVLACTDQADARHNFGHSGGFLCPLVPFLPLTSILINTYLLINLGSGTWIRVSIWLALGILIYLTYGRRHSLLNRRNA